MPVVLLHPRQAQATPSTTLAESSATRFLPPTATSDANSSDSSSNTGIEIWKYAIVVILCVFALFCFVRLAFLRRVRHQRIQAHQAELARRNEARARRQREAAWRRDTEPSLYSLDLDDPAEPPPPAYDDANARTGPVAAAGPPAQTQKPTLGSRLTSLFRRTDSIRMHGFPRTSSARSTDAAAASAYPPPSSAPPPAASSHAHDLADPATLDEVAHIREALRSAGLLGAPARTFDLSHASAHAALTPAQRAALQGASPGVLMAAAAASVGHVSPQTAAQAAADDDAQRRREERRARRRERRRREREARAEREEGLGLPTYSRKVAEGEEVLQRAEGFKTDDSGDDSGDSEAEGDGGADESTMQQQRRQAAEEPATAAASGAGSREETPTPRGDDTARQTAPAGSTATHPLA
ncbi:hypothetical protein Rhopal_003446-T1 [Rhodotorula paludigena]|uniref:Uncharacterized protein n=1 Tax=Rhodotorula paludigena TaxID=86838 RepID=A0AAV5GLQ4_9BASI|nr:hypothetical protein Rhopal_003446-T1 [Rhodotorula paludigena]